MWEALEGAMLYQRKAHSTATCHHPLHCGGVELVSHPMWLIFLCVTDFVALLYYLLVTFLPCIISFRDDQKHTHIHTMFILQLHMKISHTCMHIYLCNYFQSFVFSLKYY